MFDTENVKKHVFFFLNTKYNKTVFSEKTGKPKLVVTVLRRRYVCACVTTPPAMSARAHDGTRCTNIGARTASVSLVFSFHGGIHRRRRHLTLYSTTSKITLPSRTRSTVPLCVRHFRYFFLQNPRTSIAVNHFSRP